MEEKKNIEIVSGDGSNLDISPVYEHLDVETPKSSDKKPKIHCNSKGLITRKTRDKKSDEKSENNKKN